MSLKSFEDLECCKAARELRIFVSQNILSKFPNDEKYALTSQLKRSSRSVSDNIAEGFGRYHYQRKYSVLQNCPGFIN
jgi:four helix bundle protein